MGGGVVTANGSGVLEFTKELMLLLLENDSPERVEMYYQINKQGFCALFKNWDDKLTHLNDKLK